MQRKEEDIRGSRSISRPGLEIEETPKRETLPSLPVFGTASARINAVRLSTRGPEITCDFVRLESKLARRRRAYGYLVGTIYKRKADKVRPVDSDTKDS